MLIEKQDLFLKHWVKIHHCYVRPVLLYCCEMWELTIAGEMRLHWVECHMIRMMCGVRLVDRVSIDVLCDRVSVVKIEDMIIQSCLWWHGHVMFGDIISQICEVMEVELTGKKEKGLTKVIMRTVHKEVFGMIWLEERMCIMERNNKSKQKLSTPANQNNDIKTDIRCFDVCCINI